MDKSWINKSRLSQDYTNGVKNFLDFAFGKIKVDMLKCPCNHCSLSKSKLRQDIEGDLMCFGFLSSYTEWVLHGEDVDTTAKATEILHASDDSNSTANLLDDLFPRIDMNTYVGSSSSDQPIDADNPSSTSDETSFDELLADFNQNLYPGCTELTKLTFILKLYHIKCMCGISDKGISMVLELLKEAFPKAKFPDSFGDMKKVIRKLGLTYESIDACPNDCMLYWEANANRETCGICEASRWKGGSSTASEGSQSTKQVKKTPAKVLRYFPLKPRLQRLFMSSKTASDMRWHATAPGGDGKLRHPRDGGAWKAFDLQFPKFASDPRNVRLGLATDGFNPFGTLSTNYSIWPVVLFPYNLPPWISMKQTSMILSMIIPGKKMPGNDIDVFLQPLIKELKELWFDGIQTRDASTNHTFSMRAALMWTISDFPGFGNLSGWNTYTALACPSCNYDAVGRRLRYGKKNCFMGHRRFLPINHKYRQNKATFDGTVELRNPPVTPTGSTIKDQQGRVNITLGKRCGLVGKKRDRSAMEKCDDQQWKKKSIFFDLPYWESMVLRHNLDVMHIEKNVFDNIVYTLLDDKGKSKDNLSARKDLRELGIRSELWPDDNDKYAPASFTLDRSGKDIFLGVLKNVKLPDGYASNISSCVDVKNQKLSGLKSHDSHIIMRDLLPIAVRNLLPQDVTSAIIELSRFFRNISARVLDPDDLDKLQEHIIMTLCHMEMVFPPSFFMVMVHLTVHLVEEAKQGGPVAFRWMYPIER